MKKRDRIAIVIAVVCMILTVLFGYTYAYWIISKVQTGVNVIESNCFRIEFTEGNDIDLKNAIPVLDNEGLQTAPYTFTIENVCDTFANYQINIETFDVEAGKDRLPDSYVKANLKKVNNTKFHDTLKSNYEVEPTVTGATNAYKLAEGTLKNGNIHTYNLRLWMDENITYEDTDSMNAYFNGKISVIFTADIDPFAESGTLKKAPSFAPYTEFWAYKDNITEVEFQNKIESISGAIESWDVSATNDGSVMAYMINQGTDTEPEYKVFIQGKGGVKANPDSRYLFDGFKKLNTLNGLEYFDTSNVINMGGMFRECSKLEELDVSNFDTSNVTNMNSMFSGSSILGELNVSNFDTSNVTNMGGMFGRCSELEELDVSNFDTSKVTNMGGMFAECSKLEELDVSNFDTSNVTSMNSMFNGCSGIETLDVSAFDTSKVTDMAYMFAECSLLTNLDLSNFDTSNVSSMRGMFHDSSSLTSLNLSNFNTSKVTTMGSTYSSKSAITWKGMFENCSKLSYLNLSSFDTSNVTEMGNMFKNIGSSIEQVDIVIGDGFDTSNVIDMSGMFENKSSSNVKINFDFSKLNFINVKKVYKMFSNNKNVNGVLNFDCTDVAFDGIFNDSATEPGSQITVNYTSENEALVDAIIATKSYNSNVVKSTLIS